MNDSKETLGSHWTPPPRPEWVKRINEEGEIMVNEVVPLDEDSLINSAIRNAGGLTDFGSDEWREPFQVLLKSMEEDADLNLMGRLRFRCDVLMLLEARLRIEDTYKRHPEIDDEEIKQPIFVCGQGRSGTSFLVNVLSINPDNGPLLHWENLIPCPPPEKATYRTDPRIDRAHKIIKQWHRICPTMDGIHEFSGYLPYEDCGVWALNFMATTHFCVFGQAASYEAYMNEQDPLLGYAYQKRVMKLLQWKNPRDHWVTKDVPHLYRLEPLLKTFPDACIIWAHRDPLRAFSSALSTLGTEWWTGSDHPYNGNGTLGMGTDLEVSSGLINKVIDQLESGLVPPNQIYHLQYRDLVGDPLGSIETIFKHFGTPLSERGRKATEQYLADNPRSSRPTHKTNVSLSPEEIARARKAYKRYQEYFGIPDDFPS